jgi:hypothetical protein
MTIRIIAGLLGLVAGVAWWFVGEAGHEVIGVGLFVVGLILELVAASPLPKGETWRSLPRDDHFKR